MRWLWRLSFGFALASLVLVGSLIAKVAVVGDISESWPVMLVELVSFSMLVEQAMDSFDRGRKL